MKAVETQSLLEWIEDRLRDALWADIDQEENMREAIEDVLSAISERVPKKTDCIYWIITGDTDEGFYVRGLYRGREVAGSFPSILEGMEKLEEKLKGGKRNGRAF